MHYSWIAGLAWASGPIACYALPHAPMGIPEWVGEKSSEKEFLISAKQLCDNGNMTQENWIKYDMDHLLRKW